MLVGSAKPLVIWRRTSGKNDQKSNCRIRQQRILTSTQFARNDMLKKMPSEGNFVKIWKEQSADWGVVKPWQIGLALGVPEIHKSIPV